MAMYEIGQTVTFVIGVHTTTGIIRDIHPIAFHGGQSLLIEVATDVFEIAYADEVV